MPIFTGLLVFFLISGTAVFADAPRTGAIDPLTITMISLRDGAKWILADSGIGRPFAVGIILANNSEKSIKLWSPNNTEGAACASIMLTSVEGKQISLVPGPIKRTGIATTFTIEPRKTAILELDLLRLIGRQSPPPGKYKLQAFYRNDTPAVETVGGVWIGALASKICEIEIVTPK